eukprot:scaffold2744_cov136-Cylindrotheca_fusiformis.AAC.8
MFHNLLVIYVNEQFPKTSQLQPKVQKQLLPTCVGFWWVPSTHRVSRRSRPTKTKGAKAAARYVLAIAGPGQRIENQFSCAFLSSRALFLDR